MSDLSSSGPSAGSRRFWITVAIFALLNVGAWVGYHAWLSSRQPRRDILTLQSFSPMDGDIVPSTEPPVLSWTFNLDVSKPGPAAAGPKGEMPGTIQPAIKGEWLWTDARTLTFEAHEKPARATRFVATLNPAFVRTAEGYSLSKPVTSGFSTTPLQLIGVRQAAFDGQDRILLEIEFNDKVIPGEVVSHVKITRADGKDAAVSLHGEGAGNIVRVLTDPIPFGNPVTVVGPTPLPSRSVRNAATVSAAYSLQVKILPGLVGASGPLGIAVEQTRDVAIANVLLADSLDSSIGASGPGWLTLKLNNAIGTEDFERIKPLLSVEPPIVFTAARRGYDGRQIDLTGDFEPATRYTVKIAKVAQADDARKYPRPVTLSTFISDRPASAEFEQTTGYLGSRGNRMVLVHAVNVQAVRVSAERVYENNLVSWSNAQHHSRFDPERFSAPIASRRYKLAGKKNVPEELRISLDDLLGKDNAGDGVYALTIAPDDSAGSESAKETERFWKDNGRYAYDQSSVLVTLSDIGLTAKMMGASDPAAGDKSLMAWAVSLSTGKPLANIKVRIYSDKNQPLGEAVTDANGLARIEHVNPALEETAAVLIAESAGSGKENGRSLTWLDLAEKRNESGFDTKGKPYLRAGYEAFVWPERGVYRPGETVTLRAIVRGAGMSTPPEKMPVRWQIRRPDGHDWKSQTVMLDADGGAQWQVVFPNDVPTGYWTAQIGLPGAPGDGSAGMQIFGGADFQIEDFIPDRMKTSVKLSGPGLGIDGKKGRYDLTKGPLLTDVQTDYLFGQPAANLPSQIKGSISPAVFSSESFPATERWVAGDSASAGEILLGRRPDTFQTIEAVTQTLDKDGHTQVELNVGKKLAAFVRSGDAEKSDESSQADLYTPRGPWYVNVDVSTTEIGGRAVSAMDQVVADTVPYYVMARPGGKNGGYVEAGKDAAFDVAVAWPAGGKVEVGVSAIQAKVYRETWNSTLVHNNHGYSYESNRVLEAVEGAGGLVEMKGGAGAFRWKAVEPGSYVVEFSDAATCQVTTLRLEVGRDGGWQDNVSRENPDHLSVELVPVESTVETKADEKTVPLFHIGQNVKAIVKSPFAGTLLLTVESDRVVYSQVVEMTAGATEVPLTLPEGVRPNGYVAATVIRAVDPNKEWRLHRAFGIARFTVDSADRKLTLKISAPAEMRPGHTLDVHVAVTDAKGNAVRNSAVAIAAVDEGILQLTGYSTPNPLSFYNRRRMLGVETSDLYAMLMPEVAKLDGASKVGGDSGGEDSGFVRRHSSPVSGKRVKPVSLVSEIVHTDAEGFADAHLNVPEFLGKLKIMAVGYAGPLVGNGEGHVLVRSPLVVQTSFPRFMAPGDVADASFLLINNSRGAGSARIELKSDGPLGFEGVAPEVALAAGEQKIVRAKLSAGQAVGVSHIAVEVKLNEESYVEHLEIPVRPASPEVSRGGYVTATPEKPGELAIPTGMLPGTRNVEVRVGQRPGLGIGEGLAYLDHYPYGCLEQTTSQCFPLVYLHDIGEQIAPGVFEKESVARKVQSGITRMMGMQTASGGLAMWQGQSEEWPFGTVYAAHFLVEAKRAGYDVPEDFRIRLMGYVRDLLLKSEEPGPAVELQAYAAYVLALDGKPDRAVMNRLGEVLAVEEKAGHGAQMGDCRFHLALAWAAAGRNDLAEKLMPEVLPAPRSGRELGGNLGSTTRDEALLLMTLLNVSPENAGVTGLVERLSAEGTGRGWGSTHDNAFAVMALGKYLRATKGDKPFDSAELLDGEKSLGTANGNAALMWAGSDTAPEKLHVRVKGEAGAKAYVSWLETGVPLEMPAAADHSLTIRREYLDESDHAIDVGDLRSGMAIRVRITVETAAPLSNVVIEDLLPAGIEVENPRLATTQKIGAEPSHEVPFNVQRLDVRDDRIVVIGSTGAGKFTWTYLARAVTPGTYIVPPVRGECMYDPGINSLSGGGGKLRIVSGEKKAVAQR